MITGDCIVKRKEYGHEKWPKRFHTIPRVGDYIMSSCGVQLRVIKVTHTTLKRYKIYSTPQVVLELTV